MSHDDPPDGGSGGGPDSGADSGEKADGGEKADRHLLQALDDAEPGEELRVIVTVKGAAASGEADPGDAPAEPAAGPEPPHPNDFPDRVAYRQAMIEHHGRHPRAHFEAARQALEGLGLAPRGEGHTGLLIVQGPARSIARALRLEVVERIALDRHVEPRSPGKETPEAAPEAGDQEALGLPGDDVSG